MPLLVNLELLLKELLTENEQLSGDSFGIHDALTRPLQTSLEKYLTRKQKVLIG